jgi:chromosomal replication initiation ATPase DnaA
MPARHAVTAQLRLPLQRSVPPRADDFVLSDSNRAAWQALQGWPKAAGGVLAICGPAGSGKSHLAAIWAEAAGAVSLDGAEAALADPMELEGRAVLLDRAQDADDESLFHLINLAQSGGGALLLVSRAAPATWATALPDLRSRLDAVMTVAIDEPDDAVLAAILGARFAERSITPGGEVIDYLVHRIDRSAAAAAAVVDRLDADPRPVTRTTTRLVLEAGDDLFP